MRLHAVAAAATRLYAPLIALFAFSFLARSAPGDGVGLTAGLVFGLVLVLHALVFGAAAAHKALPTWLARTLLAFGVAAAVASAGLPGLQLAPQIMEAGFFAATVATGSLILNALFGRAAALRDAEW